MNEIYFERDVVAVAVVLPAHFQSLQPGHVDYGGGGGDDDDDVRNLYYRSNRIGRYGHTRSLCAQRGMKSPGFVCGYYQYTTDRTHRED